jgi:hypothetical protein
VAADAAEPVVRPEDHRDGVPADDPADPELDLLVAREERLLLGADRVDVAGLGQRRQPDVELAGPLEELVDEEPRPALALLATSWSNESSHSCGLGRVDVRKLVLEFVEGHGCLVGCRDGPGSGGLEAEVRREHRGLEHRS